MFGIFTGMFIEVFWMCYSGIFWGGRRREAWTNVFIGHSQTGKAAGSSFPEKVDSPASVNLICG